MKNLFHIICLAALISCNTINQKDLDKQTASDTIPKTTVKPYDPYEHCLKAVRQNYLDKTGSLNEELRFTYIGGWGGCEFFQVKFKDSVLIKRSFYIVHPDGLGKDSVHLTEKFKLTEKDIRLLNGYSIVFCFLLNPLLY